MPRELGPVARPWHSHSMRRTLAVVALLLLGSSSPAAETKTLKGQIVCGGCWDEEPDRKKTPYGTKEDVECAARCERKGVAAALAVEEGSDFRVYELARGSFKPEGRGWLKYIGKRVEATGRLEGTAKKPRLVVDGLKVVER
jgi:hypothetical protein